MPRRPPEINTNVPLFLIPNVIRQRIRVHGEAVERVVVKKTRGHYYMVSVRTRPANREFQSERATEMAKKRRCRDA